MAVCSSVFWVSRPSGQADVAGSGRKSVLIVYHGGQTPWRRMPALDVENVDALTQPTTGRINVRAVDAEAEQFSRRFLSALKEQAGRPAR